MPIKKHLKLKSGDKVPALGLGTWQMQGEEAVEAVEYALEVGYRHIDTADYYGNHRDIRDALNNSKVKREDIFLTTKVWRSDLQKQDVIDCGNRFLEELDTGYIDLLLIHWPNTQVPIKETLDGFRQLKEENKIKHIGVSNFSIKNLKEALDTGVEVENNQIELHPMLNQKELVEFCQSQDITVTAYSPLARGDALDHKLIKELGEKYSKTPAQIILNWILSRNVIVIPKSSNKKRIKENFESTEFEMEKEDLEKMNLIGTESSRLINPPFAEF